MVLSSSGELALERPDGFEQIPVLRSFPKGLLHPRIADKAYASLQRGDYVTAARDAFTDVEIYVREVAGLTLDDIGTDLMRTAFNEKNGRLSDQSLPKAERESFAHLFAGAIGAFKNPHSHRAVTMDDLREAQRRCFWLRIFCASSMPPKLGWRDERALYNSRCACSAYLTRFCWRIHYKHVRATAVVASTPQEIAAVLSARAGDRSSRSRRKRAH